MNRVRKMLAYIRLGRPLFLVGGVLFHALGVLMALYLGSDLDLAALLWGQVAVTASQLMTHYANEYFDLEADRANPSATRWSGGSRVLAEGLLPPGLALGTALFFGALALVAMAALALVVQVSMLAVALLLLAGFLAWEYSAPPLRLHSRGLGELTVALIVPVLTPLVGFTLQAGTLSLLPVLVVFPLACFQFAMILVINFPDAAGDRQTGKDTLVIRLGAQKAARLHGLVIALAYGSLPLLWWAGVPGLAVLALALPLPLGAWLAWRMQRGDGARPEAWNSLGFWSIGLLMGSAGLVLLAFTVLVFF
jgi:1,4-dihydroxy-2-naphthoate octaprenyltransferase